MTSGTGILIVANSFSPTRPSWPSWLVSCDVCGYIGRYVPYKRYFFEASHWPSDCGRINQAADR